MRREGLDPLNQELRDALRLEVQSSSPKEREAFGRQVTAVYRDFLNRWGKFIEQPIPEDEIADRYIRVDKQTLHAAIMPEWLQRKEGSEPRATTDPKGEVVFMQRWGGKAKNVWSVMPEKMRQEVSAANGWDLAEGEERLQESYERNLIAHEAAHLLEDRRLPVWFKEMGAYWYGREAEREKAKEVLILQAEEYLADRYGDLVSDFGDRVHEVYFGNGDGELPEGLRIKDFPGSQEEFEAFVDVFRSAS